MAETRRYTWQPFEASDGYAWLHRHYAAAQSPPKGSIVYLHGIQSHSGWYENSSTRLATAGYEVSFVERRGSGMNFEARGDAPGFRRLVDDVGEFLSKDRPRPVFLLAVSWGGKTAVALARKHPGLIDGLVLITPGFFAAIEPSFRERLSIVWKRLRDPECLLPIPLNDPALFTETPAWLQFLKGDALGLRRATARFLVESRRLDWYLSRAAKSVTMPVLLLLAGKDRIIDNAATTRFVEQFATRDKTIETYPSAAHTLEFEPDFDIICRELLDWLDARLPKAGKDSP